MPLIAGFIVSAVDFYAVTDPFHTLLQTIQGFSSFVTIDWLKDMNEDAWLSTLGPGVRVDFSDAVGVEVTAPFSIAGRNSPIAGWSVGARGLWTLKY